MEKVFESQTTLALFLLLFIPGFISLKVYDLLIPGERRDFTRSLADAIAYSALNLGALIWLVVPVWSGRLPPWEWYMATFFLLVGMPAPWPILFLQIRKVPIVANRISSPNPRVWDDIFSKRTIYWVIVHLKDHAGSVAFTGRSRTHHTAQPHRRFTLKKSGASAKMEGLPDPSCTRPRVS